MINQLDIGLSTKRHRSSDIIGFSSTVTVYCASWENGFVAGY